MHTCQRGAILGVTFVVVAAGWWGVVIVLTRVSGIGRSARTLARMTTASGIILITVGLLMVTFSIAKYM